jgi:hypothetical protein
MRRRLLGPYVSACAGLWAPKKPSQKIITALADPGVWLRFVDLVKRFWRTQMPEGFAAFQEGKAPGEGVRAEGGIC